MVYFEYYLFNDKKYCFLKLEGELNKSFILPNCNNLFSSNQSIMIEINNLKDFFLNKSFHRFDKNSYKSESCEFRSFSNNKIDISFIYSNKQYSLKSYIPFWGKTMNFYCWVCIIS